MIKSYPFTLIFICFYLLLLNSDTIFCQDTIFLQKIEIIDSTKKLGRLAAFINSFNLDDSLYYIPIAEKQWLQIINVQMPVYMKEYGVQNASISFRGYGAGHTLLIWNDIPLVSYSLGQSMWLSFFSDNFRINTYEGAFSVLGSPGALGSIIEAESIFSDKNRYYFGYSFTNINNNDFEFAILQQLKNNNAIRVQYNGNFDKNYYNFTNTLHDDKVEIKKDNEHLGHQLSMDYKLNKWQMGFNIQHHLNEVPASILTTQIDDNATQNQDIQLAYLRYNWASGFHWQHYTSFGWYSEQYRYNSILPPAETVSNSFAPQLYHQTSFTNGKHQVLMRARLSYQNLSSTAYQKVADRFIADQSVIYNYEHNCWQWWVSEQLQINNFSDFYPQGGVGVSKKWKSGNHNFIFAGAFSHLQRLPSFNDLYWVPGGNPDLLPEVGNNADIKMKWIMSKSFFASIFEINPFYYFTNNLIQWRPSENQAIWTPVNVNKTIQYGLQTNWNMMFSFSKFILRLSSNFLAQYAEDRLAHKELIYVPNYIFNEFIDLSILNHWTINYQFSYNSKRYTTFDNDRFLPWYTIHNLGLSFKHNINKVSMLYSLMVKNLTDVDYYTVAWYPMPKRYFIFSIQIEL
jgi:iron complex outermembrane receptor protein